MSANATASPSAQTAGHAIDTAGLASRKDRFIASLIDGVIMMVITFPIVFMLSFTGLYAIPVLAALLGFAVSMGVFSGVNYKFLKDNGQTIGKKIMKIKIVSRDNRPMEVNDILLKRYLPVFAVSVLPWIGGILCLVNAGMIFRQSEACLHDDIAKTKVVAE